MPLLQSIEARRGLGYICTRSPLSWQDSGVSEEVRTVLCRTAPQKTSMHRSSGLSAILLPQFKTAHLVTKGLRWTSEVYIAYPGVLVQELAEVWADVRGQGSRMAREERSAAPEDSVLSQSGNVRTRYESIILSWLELIATDLNLWVIRIAGGKKPGGN